MKFKNRYVIQDTEFQIAETCNLQQITAPQNFYL